MSLTMLQQESEDIEVVASVLGQMYPKVRLDPPRGGVRFRADIRGDDRIGIARFSMGFRASVTVEPQGTFTSAALLDGGLETEHGDGRNAGGLVFGQEETTATYDHSELLVVNLAEATLLRHQLSERGADTGVIRLLGHLPVPEHAALWARAVAHVYQDVVRVDEVFENDVIRTAAFDYLLSVAAQALPFEVVTRVVAGTGAGAATVRRAAAYMDSHLTEAITMSDIAAAARVSPRGLQAAFQRQLQMSPMRYLRRARVAEAHRELLDDESRTIKDVALRWGFSNPGRFTRLRREMYGTDVDPATAARRGQS
jgi:AraC-like DNA-binding protein